MKIAVIKYIEHTKQWAVELDRPDDAQGVPAPSISGTGATLIEALRVTRYAAKAAGHGLPLGFTSAKLKDNSA